MLLTVISQKLYPGAGDIDDCWIVATCWAARASGVAHLPTVPVFRTAAGVPDKPGPSGGNITDIMRAVGKLWPDLGVIEYEAPDWSRFSAQVKAGRIASLAVLSSELPSRLRFGFMGNHQVGVYYQSGTWYVANPLASEGSDPQPITESMLANAARSVAMGWILAALFPRGAVMPVAIMAGDRTLTSSRVAVVPKGTVLYRDSAGTVMVTTDRALVLDDFGYPADGSPYRYVQVGSRYFDTDPEMETGLALVRSDAVSLRVKTDAELLVAVGRMAGA